MEKIQGTDKSTLLNDIAISYTCKFLIYKPIFHQYFHIT